MGNAELRSGAAALSILGGMFVLGITDNFVPYISETGSLWQFHMVRGIMAVVLLALLAAVGVGVIRPVSWRAVLGRSIFPATAMLIYFGCMSVLPIGVVIAGLFTSPLFVLLISVVFQGTRVGAVRVGAALLGFVGALMVIQPDPTAPDLIVFLPIVAGFLYAIGAVVTWQWCAKEGAIALSAGFFGMLAVFGAIGLIILPAGGPEGFAGFVQRGWVPMTGAMWFWIAVQAVGSIIGIGLIFRGYLLGEAGYVAVFEYSLLVFASFWAWVLWDQTVGPLALAGMALIIAAGAVIALRTEKALPVRAVKIPDDETGEVWR
ncbi:drug/metabolite transporter (DMT)-like permease [Sulfitobacter undariae]|uniref:Drug/metabolite transporter (DMT)-like permease n=1 Tax=Sulfitobacter undariae TaxID=1563671 RepID=A0A7W6GZT6_9RHOB|nr:DMT family transporter [Sulfitobacter undariae]MBB3993317.1 drug/metabolite transporter (DMT)-like permease [Sulfitobacter undariae]